jgi:hypothetical protein
MNEDLHNHIEALKVYAERVVINKADLEVLQQKRAQLKEIRADIPKYEKEDLRLALKGARDEEAELLVAINKLTGGSEVGEVYEALLPIAVQLGRVCQRPLQKDLREAIRAYDSNTTSPQVFRDLIIPFLEESGGSASLSDVMHRIEQGLQGKLTRPDLDVPPGKKCCRLQDNVRREIRQMKKERILTRRGGNMLILASHDREVSQGKQQRSQRLRWKRASMLEDCFDLQASNWQRLKTDRFRELLDDVIQPKSDCGISFESQAGVKFREWLESPNVVLPEETYAVLNNWAFGEGLWYKGKSTAIAALHLWEALFCARPEIRLTDPKIRNGKKILPERFDLWWPRQLDCQRRTGE